MGKKDNADNAGEHLDNWSPKIGFGERLKAARKAKDLSGEQLGKELQPRGANASRQTVSDWESERHYPNVWQLAQICQRLDKTADFLLFGRQDAKSAISPQVATAAQVLAGLQRQELVALVAVVTEQAAGKMTVRRDPLPGSINPQAGDASNNRTASD